VNILDIQDKLKNLSQDQLAKEMQMPSGAVPQFLVLGELNRRQAMRQSMQQQNAGSQTVAQELLNSAGVPTEGASDMARSMAPQSSIAQNTGIGALPQESPPPEQAGIAALAPQDQQPVGMYAGGSVRKMYDGRLTTPTSKTPLSSMSMDQLNKLADSGDDAAINELRLREINGLQGSGIAGILMPPNNTPTVTPEQFAADQEQSAARVKADIVGQTRSATNALRDYVNLNPQDTAAAARLADAEKQSQQAVQATTQPSGPAPTYSIPDFLGKIIPKTEVKTDTSAAPKNDRSSSGTGAGGVGGKQSTYEQMLADAMANADKKAKQDKWLALAQAGMSLMSSAQPNLGAALGEAGNVGIGALQSARDTAEKTKLALGQEQYNIEEHRAALARSLAAAGVKATPSSLKIAEEIVKFNGLIDGMTKEDPNNPMSGPPVLSPADQARLNSYRERVDMLMQALPYSQVGAHDARDSAQTDQSQ
jgi:hypothetical protein